MEEHIKQIQAAIAANEAMKDRTPFLDVCCGALRTALEHARYHVEAVERVSVGASERGASTATGK